MTLRDLLLQTLLLKEEAFVAVQTSPDGSALALLTVLLAGLATALGQSVVLFINRVKPRRFVLSVLMSSSLYIFSYAAWALSIWGVGHLIFDRGLGFQPVLNTVGLGYAPHVFAFLVFVPFWGAGLGRVLTLWSLLSIMVGVQVGLSLGWWQAFLCTGLGWLSLQVLQRTIGHPLLSTVRWLQARAAGVEQIREQLASEDLIELLTQESAPTTSHTTSRTESRQAL